MRVVMSVVAFVAAAMPAFAAIQVAPAPEIGVGWPAVIGAIAAALVIFLLGRKKA